MVEVKLSAAGSKLMDIAKSGEKADDLIPLLGLVGAIDTGDTMVRDVQTRFSSLDPDRWYTADELVEVLNHSIGASAVRNFVNGVDTPSTRIPDQYRRVRVIPGKGHRQPVEFKGSCVSSICQQQQQQLLAIRNTQALRHHIRAAVHYYAKLRGMESDLEKMPLGEAGIIKREFLLLMAGLLDTSSYKAGSPVAALPEEDAACLSWYGETKPRIASLSERYPTMADWWAGRVRPYIDSLIKEASPSEEDKKLLAWIGDRGARVLKISETYPTIKSWFSDWMVSYASPSAREVVDNLRLRIKELEGIIASDTSPGPSIAFTVKDYALMVLDRKASPANSRDINSVLLSRGVRPYSVRPYKWLKSDLNKLAGGDCAFNRFGERLPDFRARFH